MEADFLVFYRIGPGCPLTIDDLDGPTFFSLATRTPAYSGVMSGRVAAQQQGAAPSSAPNRNSDQERELPSTRGVLLTSFGDLVDHVEVTDA